MATITALVTEVQARANALSGSSTAEEVIETAIAARKVELAGGILTRTTLDTQINRIIASFNGSSLIEDMIAMAASVAVDSGGGSTPKKLKVQEFLTSGTWTRPAGVDSVEVLLVGGGGGGGGLVLGSGVHGGGGSGGGGGVYKRVVPVTSITVGSTVTVTIGAGGSAGTSVSGGGAGGNSTFGSLLTAGGGGGGDSINSSTVIAGGVGVATSGGGARIANSTIALGGLGGGSGGSPSLSISRESAETTTSVVCTRYTRTGVLTHFPGTSGLTNNQVTANTNAWLAVSVPAVGAPSHERGAGGGIYTPSTDTNTYPISINGACGSGGGSVLNASANSGGGGATHLVSSSSGSYNGGTGGSGYCLVTWWE